MDRSANSVEDIRTIINRIKLNITSLNSKSKDCSNFEQLKKLIDDIYTDTQMFSTGNLYDVFDNSSSSSAAPNMTLEQAIDKIDEVEENLRKCDVSEQIAYIFKIQTIRVRLLLQLKNKNSQLTVSPKEPEYIPPTKEELFSAASKRSKTDVPSTLSSFSTKIGGPSGAVGSSGAVDAERARSAALDRAELFKELAGSIHDVVEDEKISVQDLNTIASINLQVDRSAKNIKLELVRQTIDAIQSNPRLLDSYRPETLDALVAEMVDAPVRHLNNQVWRDKLQNLLEYILTRFKEAGIGLVATLAKFFSTTRDEFISLMPATISAAVLLQILSGISWMGAPLGTQVALTLADMSFTQSIFNALAGHAQRTGARLVLFNSPLVAPLLVAGLLLIVVSLLPQKYMDKLRNLVVSLLRAIRSGGAITIRNATALLIYALDRLYVNRSRIFLGTCRLAAGIGRGLGYAGNLAFQGASFFAHGVASGARNVVRGAASVARCLFPREMLAMASGFLGAQILAVQASAIGIFSAAASQAVTTVGLGMSSPSLALTQLLTQLRDTIMSQFGIREQDLISQPQEISIATIDAQVSQDNIGTDDDPLLDGALNSASQTPVSTEVGVAIHETIDSRATSRASSRASSQANTPSNTQDMDEPTPPSPIQYTPPSPSPYTPLNLKVTEQNNNITVISYNNTGTELLQTTSDLTDNESDSEDEGASSSLSSSKKIPPSPGGGGGGGGGVGGMDDIDLGGGRRRKSYRRRPKRYTKKQYRRRVRNTRRRQKRNTKKKHYRRIRRR